MNYAVLLRNAELSDQFFNSEYVKNLKDISFWEVLKQAKLFKKNNQHSWSAEKLTKDFLNRV
jgi:hypothetical protein